MVRTKILCNSIYFQQITAQKMKFSIKDFFSKCDPHLLKKSLMENFIFCVPDVLKISYISWFPLSKNTTKVLTFNEKSWLLSRKMRHVFTAFEAKNYCNTTSFIKASTKSCQVVCSATLKCSAYLRFFSVNSHKPETLPVFLTCLLFFKLRTEILYAGHLFSFIIFI